MNSSSSSSSDVLDIVDIVLDANQVYTMLSNELNVKFIGQIGSRSTIVLNSMSYIVGNVGGSFWWNVTGKYHMFSVIGEKTLQLAGDKLYIITWNGFGSLIFNIQRITAYDAKLQYEKYRFEGLKYSLRGTEHYGPNDIIPEVAGLYPFPKSSTDIIDTVVPVSTTNNDDILKSRNVKIDLGKKNTKKNNGIGMMPF